jgi:hypothetical protein
MSGNESDRENPQIIVSSLWHSTNTHYEFKFCEGVGNSFLALFAGWEQNDLLIAVEFKSYTQTLGSLAKKNILRLLEIKIHKRW